MWIRISGGCLNAGNLFCLVSTSSRCDLNLSLRFNTAVTTMTWCLPHLSPSLSLPCRWSEINNMSHNRSFFALELSNREESVQFQTVSLRSHPPPPPTQLAQVPLAILKVGQFDKFFRALSARINKAPVFVRRWGRHWPCLGMLRMRAF